MALAKIASLLVLSIAFCIAVTSSQPNTLQIVGQCRDFTPSTNYDFEHYLGDDRGICQTFLGSDGKPQYSGGYHGTVTNPTTFYQWYRDTPGVSMGPYNIPITLTKTSNGYDFDNQAWFPLDNMGFGNYGNTGHNFGFTCQFNTLFTYRAGAGQVFSFSGDDDVFVFINKRLAIDLGGVHGPEGASVNLDSIASTFGMTDQQTYQLDVFQNERHTSGSTFHMTTDIVLVAAPVSVCGNGIVETGEQCDDGGACCSTTCQYSSSSTVCRASAGVCDVSETCTGTSSSCPSNSFASSSTVCRGSAGPCDVAESCTGSSASCPSDAYASTSTVCRPSVGPCDPAESCTGTGVSCPADFNGMFETACNGLGLLSSSFPYYDVIAFGDYHANTGDVEQRLAVGGNFNVGSGWSVGYQIGMDDGNVPFSLVVNGNANFPSGAVYPDGSGYPKAVPEEDMFIGGTFTGPDYLSSRVSTCTNGQSNCLTSSFVAAHQCYNGYQNTLANSGQDNVDHMVQWSGLYITCRDMNAGSYFLTLTPAEMSSYTWINLDSCNTQARWIINVVGTGDVTFAGGSFPAGANQVTWNIQGSGRTINIGGTQVEGNILAPNNNINQPTGVVIGKVVANNINSLQINKAQCFQSTGSSCGNGVVEVGEQCDGGSCCTSSCQFSSSSTVCRAAVSDCDVAEKCTGSSSMCPADVNYGFETACGGLDFPLAGGDYSFTDYDVIVFGNFNANTGDVERRLAVQNNFVAGAGWSVGYQIDNQESFAPFALVVGGDATWAGGDAYPDGSEPGIPAEHLFVGGSFNGPNYLASDVTGTCSTPHCLDSYFNSAKQCYSSYQNTLANNVDNVQHVAQWSTLTVNCNSATDMKYYLSVTGSELSSVTGVTMNNCNADAFWVVNVVGTDDVSFNGGSFGPGAPQVVFNVVGSGRTINVGAYQFDGSLLAPNNILHQTGGVIIGKVVVSQVTSFIQMNKYVCYNGHAASSFYVTD